MPDQSFAQFLRETYFAYQRGVYLGEIEPPELPHHEHREHPGMVYVSALGFCPLVAAKERSEAPPILPDKLRQNSFTALHNMALGSETQELLQRALCWKADIDNPPLVSFGEYLDHARLLNNRPDREWQWAFTEASVESKDLRICGRMDAVWLTFGPNGLSGKGIEIKYRAGYKVAPKLTDLYQMISYHLITGFEMWLVITNHFEIYHLVEDGNNWVLEAEDHRIVFILSKEEYHTERVRHLDYMDGLQTGPAFNPANSPNGWDCGSKKAPTKTKPGVITPTCPYWCHTPIAYEGETFEYDEDGIVIAF